MDRFVTRENIKRYHKLASESTSATERSRIVKLLAEEEAAAAIGQALSMPLAERRERHDSLFRVLSHNDIQHWADRFLTALEREPRALSRIEQMPSVGS
jgi:trehalose-6-phosphate synthase